MINFNAGGTNYRMSTEIEITRYMVSTGRICSATNDIFNYPSVNYCIIPDNYKRAL